MEDLNKNQLILLALLVSFVSSVATSIITYSLVSEIPPTITQTVNRVVERTVETVVPQPANPEIVTKEVTVVVREEDLVIDAIAKNKASLARIWKISGAPGQDEKIFAGIGIVLNSEGLIVAHKTEFSNRDQFEAVLSDGKVVAIEASKNSDQFSSFKIKDLKDLQLVSAVLGDSDTLQLGQSIISIKGSDKDQVATGRITGLTPKAEVEASKFDLIESDIQGISLGSPAINLKGEIIGVGLDGTNNFLPINLLKAELELLK